MGKEVLVVGGGTMGAGIAQVLLEAGAHVVVSESTDEFAAAARERIAAGVKKGSTDAYSALSRLSITVGLSEPVDVDLVIEAVPEVPTLKQTLLGEVEAAVPEAAIVATNTSSLSIDSLASGLRRPERFIGMHFFNPVPRSALVELVVGRQTSDDTIRAARTWVERLAKECIEVRDSPGFATSRLGLAIGLEAIRMVEEGVASAEDIDKGMVLGYRFPMGPLRLTDLVGLDVRLAIAQHLAETLGPRFTPPQLLVDKVAAGDLGRKTGKGFFEW
jgi:3-hydroxybutyryl-CoA dehydrogenase